MLKSPPTTHHPPECTSAPLTTPHCGCSGRHLRPADHDTTAVRHSTEDGEHQSSQRHRRADARFVYLMYMYIV